VDIEEEGQPPIEEKQSLKKVKIAVREPFVLVMVPLKWDGTPSCNLHLPRF